MAHKQAFMAWQSLFRLTKPFAEASLSFVLLSEEIGSLLHIDVALASWELQEFTLTIQRSNLVFSAVFEVRSDHFAVSNVQTEIFLLPMVPPKSLF